MAQIINKMDRKLMDDCLKAIAEGNDKDSELIREQLFTFDDLAKLAAPDLVAVFDAIAPDVVVHALYGIPKPFREQILQAVPSRARRAIEVEIEGGPKPNTRKSLKTQRAIADVALDMIERGVIETKGDEVEQEQV